MDWEKTKSNTTGEVETSSILDKIISSKQTSAIEAFRPVDAVASLLKQITIKEEDIVRRRFGLNGQKPETLEEIGRLYSVTRERIRQIERSSIKKIKALKPFESAVAPIVSVITSLLEQNGGLIEEQQLLSQLVLHTGDTAINRHSILFLLQELLAAKFEKLPATSVRKAAWHLSLTPLDLVDTTIIELEKLITAVNQPVTSEELLERFKKSDWYQRHDAKLDEAVIASYLDLSLKIAKNPFGEYGLVGWGSIVPKRMNDKIYLVMKKVGKPMHFNEITRQINAAGFDQRKAYAPTVHNELILNDRYVLIGRGIYALHEWGYQPGVVAEVLLRLLKRAGQPLGREELVSLVLKERLVKKNTVYLALTNRQFFNRLPDGRYTVAETSVSLNPLPLKDHHA